MGKAMKIGFGAVVVVIAIIALVTSFVFKNLDDIVRQAIEKVGSQAVGTAVTLDAVQLTLTQGRGELDGLRVANPAGFDASYVFEMDRIVLQVDPASLTGPVIVIKEATVDGASLLAEQKGLKTNLKTMMDDLKAAAGPAKSAPQPTADSGDVRLMLEQFTFENVKTTIKTQQWGDQSLTLPTIILSNIGDKETGLTPQQLANKMSRRLLKQTEKAVAKHLEKLGKDAAKKELDQQLDKNLDDKQKAQLEQAKSLFGK